jgi:hypothetical protein
MVWFNVDDGFMSSAKILSIPRARRIPAAGVWTLMGTWCARNLTDGFVPKYALDELPGASKFVPNLVSSRLWSEVEGGWQFNKWSLYQRTREQVLKERAANAARQQHYRDKRNGVSNGATNASVTDVVTPSVTAPIPSHAIPSHTEPIKEQEQQKKKSTSSARGTRLPADWEPSLDLVSWVRENCPDVDGRVQTMKFVNYWTAKTSQAMKLDWPATYRNWMLEAQERAPYRAPPHAHPGRSTTEDRMQSTLALISEIDREPNGQRQIGHR